MSFLFLVLFNRHTETFRFLDIKQDQQQILTSERL